MTGYRFQLLGGMNITIDDEAIMDISSNRIKLLLAYLILDIDFPHRRKQIAFNFWPDSSEKQALSNLRKLIHDLRGCFPDVDRYLKITSFSMQWNEDLIINSDVSEFEQAAQGHTLYELRKAEKLYRGELIPGFYDEWLLSKREMFAQLYVKVLEKLVFILEGQREYSTSIFYAKKLLVHHKLSEEYYRMLMRLHALNDDVAGMVIIYEQLCNILEDEMQISPTEETTQLFRRLKHKRSEVSSVNNSMISQSPLIGRMNEWSCLLRAWKQATDGNNGLLLLKGEAGIGKTRLAQEFRAWVESQGMHSAFAGCYPSVSALSYRAVTSWLRCVPYPPMNAIWLSELVRLLPELFEVYPDLPAPTPIKENWQLNRWFEAIERMLLAQQPLLLIIDDIQWSDKESMQFISYLLRGDCKAKLLVIATMRTEERANDAVLDLLSDLLIERKLKEIELTSFSMYDTRALMLTTVGKVLTDRHSSGLYAETGGNPLYILETIKEWFDTSDQIEFRHSPLVKTAIESRIYKQTENKQLISIVAAVGRPVSPMFMAYLMLVSEEMIIESMEHLINQKIMQKAGDGNYDFIHDVLRGVAYESMTDSSRRDCHGLIARGLIETHRDQPEKIASEIAFHYELAGLKMESIPYYEMSALEAEKIFAHETMINDYEKLCTLLPPEKILPYILKIGQAWIIIGDWQEAEKIYWNWMDNYGYMVTTRERSLCAVALAVCLRHQSKYEEARVHLDRALRHFELLEDLAGMSLAYGTLGIVHYLLGNYDQSLDYLMRRLELVVEVNQIKEDCRFYLFLGFLYYDQSEYDSAIHWFKKQVKLAAEIKDHEAMGEAMGGLTLVYLDKYELDLAFEHVTEKLEISRSIGNRMEFATAMGMLGKYYLYSGHKTHASRCFAYCVEEAVKILDWRIAAIVVGLEGRNLLEQHRFEEAEQLIARALRIFRKLQTPYFICETLHDISLLRQLQNQWDSALESVCEAMDVANQLKRKDMQFKLSVQLIRIQLYTKKMVLNEELSLLNGMVEQFPGLWGRQQYLDYCRELNGLGDNKAEPRPLPKTAEKVMIAKRIPQKILADIDQFLNK